MAVSLVNKEVIRVESIPNVKFHLKPACSVCSQEFHVRTHIPKVLNCGHTFCVICIDKIIRAVQVSFTGNGDVDTYFSCPICRDSMKIPGRGAIEFSTNHALLEATKDARYVHCTTCEGHGIETSFHICRECTIANHQFDVHTILDSEPVIHPDSYVICSTCVLKDHNNPEHTVIEYLPIRLNYQFQRSMLSVNVHSAQAAEKFALLRSVLCMLPILVEKKEKEVSNMVDLVQKAKSSQSQRLIFEKYSSEITQVNKLLDALIAEGGKLNALIGDKVNALERMNSETNAVHCLLELPDLKLVLKIPERSESDERVVDPPIDPTIEMPEDIVDEPVDLVADTEVQLPQTVIRRTNIESRLDPTSHTSSIQDIWAQFQPMLFFVFNWIKFGTVLLYNWFISNCVRSGATSPIGGSDINNFNHDNTGIGKQWIIISIGLVFLVFLIFTFLF